MAKADNLAEFIDSTGGPEACHPWTGWTSKGYGRIWQRGRKPKVVRILASQAGWDIEGKIIRHLCGNPICCNLLHLVPGDDRENAADRDQHGRTARGERHGHTKITNEQARQIRERYAAGGINQTDLGREYGLSQPAVSRIVRGVVFTE